MTFSLVGRCERTGAVGAVIASASMAVAARCTAVRAGVGAVCSQSTTDPRLRGELLDAMAAGTAARDALAALVGRTADVAYRQLAVVDAAGGAASYSGELALGEAADVHAAGAAAAGNLLAARDVPAAMLAAFQDRAGDDLAARLIAALQAGLAAGGEVSPVRSAGMVIAESEPWPVTDLRVDWHDDPVGELAGLWQIWHPQAAAYISRALRPSEMAGLCAARWSTAGSWPDERRRAGRYRPVDARRRPRISTCAPPSRRSESSPGAAATSCCCPSCGCAATAPPRSPLTHGPRPSRSTERSSGAWPHWPAPPASSWARAPSPNWTADRRANWPPRPPPPAACCGRPQPEHQPSPSTSWPAGSASTGASSSAPWSAW